MPTKPKTKRVKAWAVIYEGFDGHFIPEVQEMLIYSSE